MKKTLAIVSAGLMLAGAAACGSGVTSGTVIAKTIDPAHDETVNIPIYRTQCLEEPQTIGSVTTEHTVCSQVFSYYLPSTEHVPTHWRLELRSNNKTGWVNVSPGVYNTTDIGTIYPRGSAS